MKLFLPFFIITLVLTDLCLQNQPCKQKWVYQISSSQLTKPILFSTNSLVLFTLSNPLISIYNPTSQVATIPYSYQLKDKQSNCDKTKICCSNYSYDASNSTVEVYSVGSAVINANISLSSSQYKSEQVVNKIQNSKYKIEIQSQKLRGEFANSYLLKRTSNVVKEIEDRPLLIPQSFYKSTYQCQFLGQMDTSVCNKKCSYVMTVETLNQSGLYSLPDNSYYANRNIYSTITDFTITITIYDPPKTPIFGYVVSKVIKIASQAVLMLGSTYCINISLINPTNQSALSNLQISTPASNIYQNSLLFEQYQSLNVSACSSEVRYSVVLDGEGYDYQYQKPEQNPTNYTIPENIQKQCKGVCYWWGWVLIVLGIITLILIIACIIRAVHNKNQRKKLFLQAKLRQAAGVTLSTNPSLTTLSDMTSVTNRVQARQSNPLSHSRRILISPRAK